MDIETLQAVQEKINQIRLDVMVNNPPLPYSERTLVAETVWRCLDIIQEMIHEAKEVRS